MALMATSYSGVHVSMPSKFVSSSIAFDAQAIDWVPLGVGELSVLGDSFVLELKLSGARHVPAKALGSLVRGSALEADSRTLAVTTSDMVQGFYLFKFPYQKHASEFSRIADAAESARKQVSVPSDSVEVDEQDTKKLQASLSLKLKDNCPLIFGGAELYGSDPSSGSEVLLDRGAVLLLDPLSGHSARHVGSYELSFYGQHHFDEEPSKHFVIHPKMVLRQIEEGSDDGPAAVFEIQGINGDDACLIAFDDADVAAAFSRDFQVRLRVMQLSLKTVKGQQQTQGVKEQLQELKQQSLAARLRRLLWSCMFLLIIFIFLRLVVLAYFGRHHLAVGIILDDMQYLLAMSKGAVAFANARMCSFTTNMLFLEDVRQCAQLSTVLRVRQCIEELAQ